MTAIGAVGIELWSMSSDIYFDNVLITDDMDVANTWAAETFELKVSKFTLCMQLICMKGVVKEMLEIADWQ